MKKIITLLAVIAAVFALIVPAQAGHNPNHGTTTTTSSTTTTTTPPPAVGDLMGSGAWHPSNPPVLWVDDTFNSAEELAILAGTCGFDAVLNGNPSGITGILQGGIKDTRSVIGNGPYDLLDAAAVPSGEIWVTWDDLGSSGQLGFAMRSPQPGAWENYLIVLNSAFQSNWSTAAQYAPLTGCGATTKPGNGKIDLQTLVTHELGHAFMDFNDLYSDPNRPDPGNDAYYPNAGCYNGSGSNTQIGYTMCWNVPAADNNDVARRRLFSTEETEAILEKYWEDAPPPGAAWNSTLWTQIEADLDSDSSVVSGRGRLLVDGQWTSGETPIWIKEGAIISSAADVEVTGYAKLIQDQGLTESAPLVVRVRDTGSSYVQFHFISRTTDRIAIADSSIVLENSPTTYSWVITPGVGDEFETDGVRFRLRVEGNTASAKFWIDGTTEPSGWMATTSNIVPLASGGFTVGAFESLDGVGVQVPITWEVDDLVVTDLATSSVIFSDSFGS